MVPMIAVAVCALAMMSTSASVLAYLGYVTIHLGGVAFIVARGGDPRLFPLLPAMLGCFLVVLSLIAIRTNLALREKIALALLGRVAPVALQRGAGPCDEQRADDLGAIERHLDRERIQSMGGDDDTPSKPPGTRSRDSWMRPAHAAIRS